MTISINIHEAKAKLSHLLALARQGEEVIICNRNVPQARLMPYTPPSNAKPKRQFGQYKGQITLRDDFFEPLSEEELGMSLQSAFPDN